MGKVMINSEQRTIEAARCDNYRRGVRRSYPENTDLGVTPIRQLETAVRQYFLIHNMMHICQNRIIFITYFSTDVPLKSYVFFPVGLSSLTRLFQQFLQILVSWLGQFFFSYWSVFPVYFDSVILKVVQILVYSIFLYLEVF